MAPLNAQNLSKAIQTKTNHVFIHIEYANNIVLRPNPKVNQIKVNASNEEGVLTPVSIEDHKDYVMISGQNVPEWEEQPQGFDKQCTIQPLYNNYEILLPPQVVLKLVCLEANVDVTKLNGDLDFNLDEGFLTLKKLEGKTVVKMHSGQVKVDMVNHTNFEAHSNLGSVILNAKASIKQSDKNNIIGQIGKAENTLKIETKTAKIILESFR